jgi:hypothetical protein
MVMTKGIVLQIESQIAEIPIVPRDFIDAGNRGKIVIPSQTGHSTSHDKNQERYLECTYPGVSGRSRVMAVGLDLISDY